MKRSLKLARRVGGTIRVPGDKSIAHRALILGALARDVQVIRNLPRGEDVRSTIRCLRALGVSIDEDPDGTVRVYGRGLQWGADARAPAHGSVALNAGNSGTTTRLLAGLVAGLGLDATFSGDASLSRRPMAS